MGLDNLTAPYFKGNGDGVEVAAGRVAGLGVAVRGGAPVVLVGLAATRVRVPVTPAVVVNVVVGVTVGSGVDDPAGGVAVTITVMITGASVGARVGRGALPQPMAVNAIVTEMKANTRKMFFIGLSPAFEPLSF